MTTAATRKSFRCALRRQFLALNHLLAESSNSNFNETDGKKSVAYAKVCK